MVWFNHDEIIYKSMIESNVQINQDNLYLVRYHSFYPYHDKGAYIYIIKVHMIKR